MSKITIISCSVRDGRLSHRIALFLKKYTETRYGVNAAIADLKRYDFPLFHERLMYLDMPPAGLLEYSDSVRSADGIIVVSPVYNGSFPASLKNAVDVLYTEWEKKPVLIVSVTYGVVPGITTVQHLQNLFMKLEARVVSPLYTVLKAGTDFTEEGEPLDQDTAVKFAEVPLAEFMWLVENSADGK